MPARKPLKRKSLTRRLSARRFEIDCSAAFFYALECVYEFGFAEAT